MSASTAPNAPAYSGRRGQHSTVLIMNWRAGFRVVTGMADIYPSLGFDPCPGDLTGYRALAAYASRSATVLSGAVRSLAAAGSDQWRGQAADAFRTHVHADVLPLAGKAADSVGRAATALHSWALTLAALQDEARTLDRQVAPYHVQLTAALRAAGLPATAQPPYAARLTSAQQSRIDEATTALAGIAARAEEIHAQYVAAVQRAGSQLEDAGNMAPHPPGLFASLWHDVESHWDDVVRGASDIVHDKAVWEFIAGVANVVATAAGLLALIPSYHVARFRFKGMTEAERREVELATRIEATSPKGYLVHDLRPYRPEPRTEPGPEPKAGAWSMPEPRPYDLGLTADPGLSRKAIGMAVPSPYDLGLTSNPERSWDKPEPEPDPGPEPELEAG
jgi:hypothetical protein